MTNRFLPYPEDNVFNYFILPLIGLNKESFGKSFNKCLLSKDGIYVWVKVNDANSALYARNNPFFSTAMNLGEDTYYIFVMAEKFKNDSLLIAQGKYSKISPEAKDLIKEHSGLLNGSKNIPGRGAIKAKALCALDKDPALIWYYMSVLGLTEEQVHELIVQNQNELLDRPNEEDFIEYFYKQEESI